MFRKSMLALAIAALGSPALAAVSADEAKQLGTTLTAVGAEKAGNKEGTIPEYTGGLKEIPPAYKKGSGIRPSPFENEKPRLVIDSKNADMKNIGGRYGGAITGAQFIQRFVKKDTPWAHLDVAGTAMDSSRNDINQSWGSGWGVRLLDRLVAENYEKAEK